MDTKDILPFYDSSPKLELPHQIPGEGNQILTELNVYCKSCEKPATDLRGVAKDYPNCTEFVYAGVCHQCHTITQAQCRVYNDGRLLHRSDHGWDTYEFKTTRLDKALKFLRRLIGSKNDHN